MTEDEDPAAEADTEAKSPQEIRSEIEQTREELGDTVEALAAKTDVKSQAQDRITAARQTFTVKRDEWVTKAKQASPESASGGAQQLSSTVQEKPLPFAAAGAFAAGLIIGRLTGRR